MKEYAYDEDSVRALTEWAAKASFPKEMRLNDAEYIFDVPRYVDANLKDIQAHYPDPFYHPAIARLYHLKEALEK
ncbi:MAG TPA: hypothetical protein K8W02_07510 [Mediterranea massiliensis]|uniref:DUF6965 domain-containing protein n=1 Tax=Mediterranea massiliensis TaxID=1841865 RepID=A0A921LBY0_9BACT|nr:hypothetical protein [Mediterranea massiliensis]MBM6734931.1 hypothetical protein [Mediterranea massiliensis]HJF92215.1 hypothetical protein [Mediterranea massiliensis]